MSYPSQGTPIDNDFHPVDSDMSATDDHWGTVKMAGDVTTLRPDSPTVNDYAADRQKINERSMKDIAIRGPSAVDTNHLKIFPGSKK